MVGKTLDVVGIGNAIVDVLARHDDAFLETHALTKGAMTLIDADRAVELYDAMEVSAETSGGSAGNTMTGVASLGVRRRLSARLPTTISAGSSLPTARRKGSVSMSPPAAEGAPTGRSMIVVTPDAERTMNTFLGAATTLYRHEIPVDVVAASQVLYCEGYIWDIDVTKDAIRHAIAVAKANDTRISFTLSDSFCVDRHFDEWHQLLDDDIDILFGNEEELLSLTRAASHAEAIEAVRGRCEILCATLGSQGSLIVTADETIEVPAFRSARSSTRPGR